MRFRGRPVKKGYPPYYNNFQIIINIFKYNKILFLCGDFCGQWS